MTRNGRQWRGWWLVMADRGPHGLVEKFGAKFGSRLIAYSREVRAHPPTTQSLTVVADKFRSRGIRGWGHPCQPLTPSVVAGEFQLCQQLLTRVGGRR
ncbi:hypothetical protein CRG98_010085 [Punica granatum]|uniref:Uncharacterized protein n=1 Tax=Punica granatum TaxID=22663 RepID=A0A2I0KME5_PUNGR|nr:hypothetical protein CRG98_010085 [Punica granatum]